MRPSDDDDPAPVEFSASAIMLDVMYRDGHPPVGQLAAAVTSEVNCFCIPLGMNADQRDLRLMELRYDLIQAMAARETIGLIWDGRELLLHRNVGKRLAGYVLGITIRTGDILAWIVRNGRDVPPTNKQH